MLLLLRSNNCTYTQHKVKKNLQQVGYFYRKILLKVNIHLNKKNYSTLRIQKLKLFQNKPVILNLCEEFFCREHVSVPGISVQSSP